MHQYVSDFYKRQGLEKVCSRKFDETALLAMGRVLSSLMLILGILIEELVNEYIGMEGHKVFIEQSVEAHDDDDDNSEDSGDTRNRNVQLDTEYDDHTDDREDKEEVLDDESSDF